jgi:L-asparaginase/Glu-tRNA(Gln) amidotransferase subunit D
MKQKETVMTKRQRRVAQSSFLVPLLIAVLSGGGAYGNAEGAKKQAKQKVTREELAALIDNTTNINRELTVHVQNLTQQQSKQNSMMIQMLQQMSAQQATMQAMTERQNRIENRIDRRAPVIAAPVPAPNPRGEN